MAQATKSTPKAEGSKKPVKELTAWPVRVSVWKHTSESGTVSYSTKVKKTFRREGSEQWEDSDYLSEQELLAAARLLGEVWDWIRSEREFARRSS